MSLSLPVRACRCRTDAVGVVALVMAWTLGLFELEVVVA